MFSMSLRAAKEGFFDRKAVIAATDRATRSALNEGGRAVRRTAQKSLVYADGVSSPGQPPHAHKTGWKTRTSKSTGRVRRRAVSFLRENIFYAYDKVSRSVIVGPALLNGVLS